MAVFDIWLVVPTYLTKSLKDQLEKHRLLDKSTKIRAVKTEEDLQGIVLGHEDERENHIGRVIIPTTMKWGPDDSGPNFASAKRFTLVKIDFSKVPDAANIILALRPASPANAPSAAVAKSPIAQVTANWVSALPVPTNHKFTTHLSSILSTSSWSYTMYPPMLLLPSTKPWTTLLSITQPAHMESLYAHLCSTFKVTHIALNGPIPLHSSPQTMDITPHVSFTQPTSTQARPQANLADPQPFGGNTGIASAPSKDTFPARPNRPPEPDPLPSTPPPNTTTNILRSPTALTPLYGPFGPLLPPTHTPTRQDLASSFWCSVQQNGIHQVWAPRYTMFSRGNITEKARILKMPVTIGKAAVRNSHKGNGYAVAAAEPEWSAVDLYAGIGYFAFSYVQRGAAVVLCWEINLWSVEGLRRGARANRWPDVTVVGRDGADNGAGMGKLIVYAEDNQFAAERIERLRPLIPPIRHVNCGFLPTSFPSWQVAVKLLDPLDGGWIHVHENIAITDIAKRAQEIVVLIKSYVATTPRSAPEQWTISCPHIERVKSYAPGVLHCVLDISITPPPVF